MKKSDILVSTRAESDKFENLCIDDTSATSQPVMEYSNITFGVLVTPGTRLVIVLEGQSTWYSVKKAPSTRVHLTFARSNKLTNKMNFR